MSKSHKGTKTETTKMKAMDCKKLQIRLPYQTHSILSIIAKNLGITVSDLILRILVAEAKTGEGNIN